MLLKKIETSTTDPYLDLTDFGLENTQIQELVQYLNKNSHIQVLSLRHNNLGDECIEPLKALTNIRNLDVSYNDFTEKGINGLVEAYSKSSPTTVTITAEKINSLDKRGVFFSKPFSSSKSISEQIVSNNDTINEQASSLFLAVLNTVTQEGSPEEQAKVLAKLVEKIIEGPLANSKVKMDSNKEAPKLGLTTN